jgi:hypothetical protein
MLHELQILSLEIAATSLFSMEASTFGSELREMVSNYMDTVGRLYPTDVLLPDGVPTLLRARRPRGAEHQQLRAPGRCRGARRAAFGGISVS